MQYNLICFNIIRCYLAAILVFLPFQNRIYRSNFITDGNLAYFLQIIDEITIVILLPLAIIIEVTKYRQNINSLYLIMVFSIVVFGVTGFMSGFVNGNSFLITSLGVFDYIKNFLVIFIYAAFFKEFKDLKKIFYILLIVMLFLGAIALIQEIWAMGSRYIMGKSITDKKIYILTNIYNSKEIFGINNALVRWRHGIYRAVSFIGQSNLLGLYSLFFFTLYIFINKRFNWIVLGLIFTGIFVSLSRMIYSAFALILTLFFFKDKKWVVIALVPILLFLSYMSFGVADRDSIALEEQSFRSYSREQSLVIWKDHALLGVGAGMYGGIISVKYNSHIYSEYNFISHYFNTGIAKFGSMDQFWPQVLVETGIIGCFGFAGMIFSLFFILVTLRKRAANNEERSFLSGLICFIFVFNIYLLGSGLNLAMVLYTYLAFVGMALGCVNNQKIYNGDIAS